MKYTLAMTLICLASCPAWAQEPMDWTAKLGSRHYLEREKAARALEQLGKAAMPVLKEMMFHADLETKRRAILIMERIEDRVLIEELTTATPLRLRFQDLPINDALREVETQTGLQCGNAPGSNRLTLDTGTVPYWQALRRFCAAAQLKENDYARAAAKLKRLSAQEVDQLVTTFGRSGIEIRTVYSVPRLVFSTAPALDSYRVDDGQSVRVRLKWHALGAVVDETAPHAVFAVEVRAEPRLEIVTAPRAEITRIVDAEGRASSVQSARLFPTTANVETANFLAAYVGEIQYGGFLHLQAIPWQGRSHSLKEVHGRVRTEVKVRPRMVEIGDILQAVGKEVKGYQGVTLKVLEAETTEEGDVHLRLRLGELASLTPQAPDQIVRVRPGLITVRGPMDVALERLELLDASGRKCKQLKAKYEQAAGPGKSYEAEVLFAGAGTKTKGLTLVMTKAPRTVPLEVPFLVRDVAWSPGKDEK